MLKLATNPFLIRFVLWLVAAIVALVVFLELGGFAQVLDCMNDMF